MFNVGDVITHDPYLDQQYVWEVTKTTYDIDNNWWEYELIFLYMYDESFENNSGLSKGIKGFLILDQENISRLYEDENPIPWFLYQPHTISIET